MVKLYTPPSNTEGVELLLSDNRGIYIPKDFIESADYEYYGDLSTYEKTLSNPDDENYWHDWITLIGEVEVTDINDNVWMLWQDGDLFLICEEYMDDEKYEEFFGEKRHD